MNKDMMQLSQAISKGVADGIKKGLELPEAKLPVDFLSTVKAIKEHCNARRECDGCMFEGEFEHCKISGNLPQHWDV